VSGVRRRALLEQDVVQALDAEFGVALEYRRPEWNRRLGEQLAAVRECDENGLVACLVPARMDTRWWWDHCRYGEVRFLRGRVRFDGHKSSAPFPSAVVIFGLEPRTLMWDVRDPVHGGPHPIDLVYWERRKDAA
jgi:hypothetical protein